MTPLSNTKGNFSVYVLTVVRWRGYGVCSVTYSLSNLWSINTGQSSTYVQFLHRQRSEHLLSSSWSTTLGHLGQRIEECILPPQTLQVWFYAESWKGCRYVEQLPSSAIKNWIFFFEVSLLRNGGWPVFSISFNFTKTSSNFTNFRTSRPLWSEVQELNFLKWSSWNSTDSFVYYESIKREVKIRGIYECRSMKDYKLNLLASRTPRGLL
jgi:hypothetical protein